MGKWNKLLLTGLDVLYVLVICPFSPMDYFRLHETSTWLGIGTLFLFKNTVFVFMQSFMDILRENTQ